MKITEEMDYEYTLLIQYANARKIFIQGGKNKKSILGFISSSKEEILITNKKEIFSVALGLDLSSSTN